MPVNQYADNTFSLEIDTGEDTIVIPHHVATSAARQSFLLRVSKALLESGHRHLVELSGDTELIVTAEGRRVEIGLQSHNGKVGSVWLTGPDNVCHGVPYHPEVVAGLALASLDFMRAENPTDMDSPAAHFCGHGRVRDNESVVTHRMHGDAVEIDTWTHLEEDGVRLDVHVGVDARRAAVVAAHAPDSTRIIISANDFDALECGPSATMCTTITIDQAHSLVGTLEEAIADAVTWRG